MASFIDDFRRNMLPLWRSYNDTYLAKELDFTGQKRLPVCFDRYVDFRAEWKNKHTIISAANLVNAAVASGNKQRLDVVNAAEFLLNHQEECSPLAIDVAHSIVDFTAPSQITEVGKELSFEERADRLIKGLVDQETETKAYIGLLRRQVREHCQNSIAYCELARCYANLGMDKKAERYMDYAVGLAPQSRYITRCAARFYVHIKDLCKAKRVLIASGLVKSDPWVMSAEIAVESLMDKSSHYITIGRQLVLSNNVSAFSSSELCFAICNEDKKAGKRKDARKMYDRGILDPNDNSLAQAEFFAKDDVNLNIDLSLFNNISHKNEAETRKAFSQGEYEDAFISSMMWMHDYRFEHRPIDFAFNISCDYLKRYDYAIAIVQRYLNSSPNDPAAINNLAYALGLSNRTEEAEAILSKIEIKVSPTGDNTNGICLIATCGLIEFRKGNVESGRDLYNKAITIAKRRGDKKLSAKARLNMIREEIHSADVVDEKLLMEMEELNTGNRAETEQLKGDIIAEVEKKNEKRVSSQL